MQSIIKLFLIFDVLLTCGENHIIFFIMSEEIKIGSVVCLNGTPNVKLTITDYYNGKYELTYFNKITSKFEHICIKEGAFSLASEDYLPDLSGVIC